MLLVERLFPTARERLVTLGGEAHVKEAAALLADRKYRLVVVCDQDQRMIGVVARRDIVRELSHCLGYACTMACSAIMTTDVIVCRSGDALDGLWKTMAERGLRSVPIVDDLRHPLGVATAPDIAEIMLSEVEYDQNVMKEYVMSVGYR